MAIFFPAGKLALVSYVAIGFPAALALAFVAGFGVAGIAAGHTLGKLLMTAATGAAVMRTDWRRESDAAGMRVRALSSGVARSDALEHASDSVAAHDAPGDEPQGVMMGTLPTATDAAEQQGGASSASRRATVGGNAV